MKNLINILLLTIVTLTGFSQTIKRGSINSVGFTSPNVNFSVGQFMAGNFNSGTNKITVGFQQPVRIMLDTSVAIIGDLSICPGDTTVIKANSSPFYTWFKNDTAIKAKDTSLIKLTQKDTGVYKIACWVIGKCKKCQGTSCAEQGAKGWSELCKCRYRQHCSPGRRVAQGANWH